VSCSDTLAAVQSDHPPANLKPRYGYLAGQLMSNQALDNRQMRAIAHKLKPVVTVAQKGISETVHKEIDQALTRHEIIKVKIVVGDRDLRKEVAAEICDQTCSELVQSIGNIVVLYRAARQPDPKLSNILRNKNMPGL